MSGVIKIAGLDPEGRPSLVIRSSATAGQVMPGQQGDRRYANNNTAFEQAVYFHHIYPGTGVWSGLVPTVVEDLMMKARELAPGMKTYSLILRFNESPLTSIVTADPANANTNKDSETLPILMYIWDQYRSNRKEVRSGGFDDQGGVFQHPLPQIAEACGTGDGERSWCEWRDRVTRAGPIWLGLGYEDTVFHILFIDAKDETLPHHVTLPHRSPRDAPKSHSGQDGGSRGSGSGRTRRNQEAADKTRETEIRLKPEIFTLAQAYFESMHMLNLAANPMKGDIDPATPVHLPAKTRRAESNHVVVVIEITLAQRASIPIIGNASPGPHPSDAVLASSKPLFNNIRGKGAVPQQPYTRAVPNVTSQANAVSGLIRGSSSSATAQTQSSKLPSRLPLPTQGSTKTIRSVVLEGSLGGVRRGVGPRGGRIGDVNDFDKGLDSVAHSTPRAPHTSRQL